MSGFHGIAPGSQLLLAIPLVLLYEVSLIAIWFTERRRARDAGRVGT